RGCLPRAPGVGPRCVRGRRSAAGLSRRIAGLLPLGALRLRRRAALPPGLRPFGALLRRVAPALGALLRVIASLLAALLVQVFAVIHPVFARVFTVVVPVVVRASVHVEPAAHAVGTVVVVVVHGGADRDAGGEADQARYGGIGAVVFLHVDDLRVVLRHVDDLRVGGLDDDHGLSRLGLAAFHVLLRRVFERTGVLGLR